MSETYQSKRDRRQRMLESLPPGLREHIAQRNIDAVAALSPQAQTRLLEAVLAGLKRVPRAIEQLRADLDTSIADLLNPPALPVIALFSLVLFYSNRCCEVSKHAWFMKYESGYILEVTGDVEYGFLSLI